MWGGVPVMTTPGVRLASRVASSFARVVDHRMTALTLKEYVDVAVTLGRNRKRLLSLRRVVRSRRRKTAMFDTRRWVGDLELSLRGMWESYIGTGGGHVPVSPDRAMDHHIVVSGGDVWKDGHK